MQTPSTNDKIALNDKYNSVIVLTLTPENGWSWCISGYNHEMNVPTETEDYDGYENRHDAAVAAFDYLEAY